MRNHKGGTRVNTWCVPKKINTGDKSDDKKNI